MKGCGIGDISTMLETGYLGGKCADLNALYVGLARAADFLPGMSTVFSELERVQESRQSGRYYGRAALPRRCLSQQLWLAARRSSDVRKVVLEENLPGEQLPLDDPKVKKARAKLFGAWEMNWLPYNYSHDVKLPNSNGPELGFLMYPQAETANGRKDSLDPKSFSYTIKSKEV